MVSFTFLVLRLVKKNQRRNVASAVVESSFFGMESFSILSPSSTDFILVEFGAGVVHTVPLSQLSSGSPQRLNVLLSKLIEAENSVAWKDETDIVHYVTDHGQIAAIVASSVLGVLVLCGIVAVAIRLNTRIPPRKATPKELLDNAVMMYLDEDEPTAEEIF